MARKKEKFTLWEARYHNYEFNYNLRQQFKTFDIETQNKYRIISSSIKDWKVNKFGSPTLNDELENEIIFLALQNHLPDAFFLIGFYNCEEGWNDYVRQFNELDPDESYPPEKFDKTISMRKIDEDLQLL